LRIREFCWDSWAKWAFERWAVDLPTAIAVDTETTGLGFHDVAFCATLTWRRPNGDLQSAYIELDDADCRPIAGAGMPPAGDPENRRALLRAILHGTETWVFWNAKFDLARLDYLGILPPLDGHIIEDGQPIAALINENRRMKLKVRAVEDLGFVNTIQVQVQSGPRKGEWDAKAKEEHLLGKLRTKLKLTKEDGYHLIPREAMIPYALTDTELTLRWWEKHAPLLPEDLIPVYDEEIEVAHILRKMEGNGVGIDVPYLTEAEDEWGAKVMTTWQTLVGLIGRDDFNPNSPKQLLAAFKTAGVTLESTDKAHLRDMVANRASPKEAVQIALALREYRDAEKVHGTYLTSLLADQRDSIAHPWLNPVGPRTGRMSSSVATND
jgi:DNA polymerase I-like protein with 3'-5' exonuclease and polymerase domains